MQRIDESHSFSPRVACVLKNTHKAILLKEIYYWVHKNWSNEENVKGGVAWTYNTAKAYHEKFPYMPVKSIQRWLKELVRDRILFATNCFNKKRYDKTNWYTINHDWYDLVVKGEQKSLPQNEAWSTKITQSLPQNEVCMPQNEATLPQNGAPIPPSTYTSTNTTSSRSKNASEEILEVVVENENPFQEEMKNDYDLLESLQRKNNLSRAEIFELAEQFNDQKRALGEQHTEYRKWKKNFYFWVPIQKQMSRNETRTDNRKPKFTKTKTLISAEDCAAVAHGIINQRSSYDDWGI